MLRSMVAKKGTKFLFLSTSIVLLGVAEQCLSGEADEILRATGVRGGLVVHVGCGDGKLTAALCANDSYLVHGLDPDAANVEKAGAHICSRGLRGKASVERWQGVRLPYTDNLVNLVVVSNDEGRVSKEELLRVLRPGGVALATRSSSLAPLRKPWPRDIDEWTHFLHEADNNAVARDKLVGPPKHMQWVAGPMYCRSHEIDSSISAVVSARGRIFYIQDEGLIGITDERLPETWSLFARDAFNGVLLWKRSIPKWGWPEWKRSRLAGEDWSTLRGQRGAFPSEVARRLVAQGGRVYVTLGYRAPVTALDAATGEVLRTYKETEGADEMLLSAGTLVLRVKKALIAAEKRRTGKGTDESIVAIEAESGKMLWRADTGRMLALSLAADGERVYFFNRKAIASLSLETGKELWRTPTDVAKKPQKKGKKRRRRGGYTLVVHSGVVLLMGPDALLALSAKTGDIMWTGPGARGVGAGVTPDLFVAGGLAWHGRQTPGLLGPGADGKRRGRGAVGAKVTGRDLRTGEVKKTLDLKNIISPYHHFRCHRSKATERYILWPKRGVEFIDLAGDDHMRHDWLRAPCKYGVLPCNGLLYVPPHQCFCYAGVKLGGFNALASQRSEVRDQRPEEETSARLQRGPAYVSSLNTELRALNTDGDWPTYRHDAKRSGATKAMVPARVALAWEVKLGGRLTQPTVAGGKVFVASVDAHTVYALDAASSKQLWSYTAGGPVDSPPTIHTGLVLFGSADGWVYCLRASDGALAWRFRAAPEERRVIAFGQLESAWPVHGSVLVKDGIVYCSAGRSSYLDGGIRLYGLDPRTGKVLHEGRIEGPYPDLSKDIGRPFDMQGTFSDVLVTDGSLLYMQQVMLDSKLVEHEAPRISAMGDRKVGRHIFSTAGFLDDSGFNRTFWMHSERWPGFYIANQSPKAGQLLVFDDTTTYGVKCYTRRNCHSPMFFPGKEGYLLFADDNDNEPQLVGRDGAPKPVNRLPYAHYGSSRGRTPVSATAADRDKGVGFTSPQPPKWQTWVPLRVRAMARAGETLFIAGPPDVLDPDDPLAAFQGRKGGLLWAVSPRDGTKLFERRLESDPVFDGLVAAAGRLYLTTTDGSVLCMAGAK